MDKYTTPITVINSNTGEIIKEYGYSEIFEKGERELIKKIVTDKMAAEEKDYLMRKEAEKYGQFIWGIYKPCDKYIHTEKPSYLTRLIFLATFLSYDGVLRYDNNVPIGTKLLKKELGLSEREYYNFISEMKESKIMYERESLWYINPQLFAKGKLPKSAIKQSRDSDLYHIRLYCNAIRTIYKQATVRSHKTLSHIFQIIPFVNRKYNIVCWNPYETNLELIKTMTLGEYCDLIGYNRSNATKLYRTLFDPVFDIGDGEKKSIIRYVAGKGLKKDTYSIFINPRVYYAGDEWEKVEVLGGF